MCDPFTLIGGAAALGGSLMSGAGALSGGRAAASNGRIAYKSAQIQNEIQKSNAALSLDEGAFEAGRARDAAKQAADQAVGFYSAGGVDPGFGGAAWAQAWSATQGEQDAQIALARGQGQAAQHLQQGGAALAQGATALTQGQDARRAGNLSFAANLLSGVGSFAKLAPGLSLSPTSSATAHGGVSTGDPWGSSMRWGYTGSQPNFWHR